MTNKKSFLLYKDQEEIFTSLNNEQAGLLIKSIFRYCNCGELPTDPIIKLIFISIKQTLIRDQEKWESIAERNRENGLKGGRPSLDKNPEEPKEPSGLSGNPEEPRKPVSVSVNDSDSVKDITSKEVIHKSEASHFKGNKLVNKVIEEFEQALGFKPTDRKPRFAAMNLVKRLQRIIKDNGKEANEEVSLRAISNYFKWLKNQDWFEMVQTVDTCRRKTDIFVHDYNLKGENNANK